MMKTIVITLEDLKNFYMNYHGYYDIFRMPKEEAFNEFFKRIPSIQYDPLDVVGRNADLVLFSRIREYNKEILYNKIYVEKHLIDGWDKQMGIYETKYFGHYYYIREAQANQINDFFVKKYQVDLNEHKKFIMDTLKDNGPLASSKINLSKLQMNKSKYENISSLVCDYLFHKGVIGVDKKTNVVKHYNLIEKIIPFQNNPFLSEEEFAIWYTKRRIGNIGAVWNKNGSAWLSHHISKKEKRTQIIKHLHETGEILQLNIIDFPYPLYIRKEDEKFLFLPLEFQRAIFIAPLDSFIWDRELIKQVFNFDYTWEVYVPLAKRKYGYYVIPVMIGNQFVGRFEPNVARKNLPLTIKNWWWEKDFSPSEEDIALIIEEYLRLGTFIGSSAVDIEGIKSLFYQSKS